jgi:hypothetical protein
MGMWIKAYAWAICAYSRRFSDLIAVCTAAAADDHDDDDDGRI